MNCARQRIYHTAVPKIFAQFFLVLMACLPSMVLAVANAAAADSEQSLFPFVISYDAPENATNVSALLERPAGKNGFVRAEDGRLVTNAGPIRFWATNLCFDACFPSHEEADRLAARLARFGINCVRMHHMDSRSIWGKSPNKLTIDPEQLERLDYVISRLKQEGIYTNINLHVSRWLDEKEGFPAQQQRPKYDKGLGNFEPRMIEAQKQYARDLLTHVNPYTKTRYADEPAVAFVEISNEDALFTVWNGGDLDSLPDPYATTYRDLWNAWLQKKYGSTDKLRAAWKAGEKPLGAEMLANGDFFEGTARWSMERDGETKVDWLVTPGGPEGRPALRIEVLQKGSVAWHPQIHQAGLELKKDSPYTLAFFARSDKKRQLNLNAMMAHEPWQRLGFSSSVEIGPEWKMCRFTFVAEQDDSNARITFSNLDPGTYELAGVSLRPGGIVGLQAGERLEDRTVPVLRRGELNLTRPARRDFVDFLWETERDYWHGMYRFLKDDLGVRCLVSGTQLSYSPVTIQAALDYIDAHSYWEHPRFPGRPWDPNNWFVRNIALVNSPGGTLASLAVRRVAGMAYTVSEYNHPAPNAYAAEAFPMIAAFGGFQAWDGVFSFTWSHNTDFEPRRIPGFFDIKSDTGKLAHTPAAAALFLRGDVARAEQTVAVPVSADDERRTLHETLTARQLTAKDFGLDPRVALQHAIGMKLVEDTDGRISAPPVADDAESFVSDTGQLRWDVSEDGAGYFIADTPRTKLFTGFIRGRTFTLGDAIEIKVGPSRLDWATISLTAMDADRLTEPGRILVAATGWIQNRQMQVESLGDDRITVGTRWGSEPILCEGITAEVMLPIAPGRVRFYPLDESGNRRAAIGCETRDGRTVLSLEPRHRTVWYEAEIR